jgi:hypothetical protein
VRPTPAETIAGVQRVLTEVIAPAVQSDYALARLREIQAVLGRLDWDDSLTHLRRDNSAAARLLASGRLWLDADPSRAAAIAVDRERLDRACTEPDGAEPFAVHNARAAECAQAAIELASGLGSWLSSHPGDSEARILLDAVRRHYAAPAP